MEEKKNILDDIKSKIKDESYMSTIAYDSVVFDTVKNSKINFYTDFVVKEKTAQNLLVGNFLEKKYVISQELKEEFVKRKKYLETLYADCYVATLPTQHKSLRFVLEASSYTEETLIAKFFILEHVQGIEMKTFIADYIGKKSMTFNQTAREKFNIHYVEEENEIEIEEFDFLDKILKKNKKKKEKERQFVVEMYSELFVMQMIMLLEKGGEKELAILEEFYEKAKENGLDNQTVPSIYTKLKEILDEQILENENFQEILESKEENIKILKDYKQPIKDFDEIYEKMEKSLKKEEKQGHQKILKTQNKKTEKRPIKTKKEIKKQDQEDKVEEKKSSVVLPKGSEKKVENKGAEKKPTANKPSAKSPTKKPTAKKTPSKPSAKKDVKKKDDKKEKKIIVVPPWKKDKSIIDEFENIWKNLLKSAIENNPKTKSKNEGQKEGEMDFSDLGSSGGGLDNKDKETTQKIPVIKEITVVPILIKNEPSNEPSKEK